MKDHKFGVASESNLIGVHPALVAVTRRALILSRRDFSVVEGVRTGKRQAELIASGASRSVSATDPRRSTHLVGSDGYGHAVDLRPVGVKNTDRDLSPWYHVIMAMQAAAIQLNVNLFAGYFWPTLVDCPHFELADWRAGKEIKWQE